MEVGANRKIGKKILSIIFAIVAMLSTMLIFLIPAWIVIIINVCEIIIFRLVFRNMHFSVASGILLYLLFGVLMVAIMLAVLYFPEKIHGGMLQNISGTEKLTEIEKIKWYRGKLGWLYLIILLGYIFSGGYAVVCAVKESYVLLGMNLVKPMSNMGALSVVLTLISVFPAYGFYIVAVAYLVLINIFFNMLYSGFTNDGGDWHIDKDDYSGGGSSSEEYSVIIIKH